MIEQPATWGEDVGDVNIFLFEFVTGGGFLGGPVPTGSILAEGAAMLAALAWDVAQLEGVQATVLWDARLDPAEKLDELRIEHLPVATAAAYQQLFDRLCRKSDATILIAPELDGVLLEHCRQAEQLGARLLSPSAEFVALTADKTASNRHLHEAGVPVPPGRLCSGPGDLADEFAFPIVVKRNDGAGSCGLQRIMSRDQLAALPALPTNLRIESYIPGLAASVALLCGPNGQVLLPAMGQRLSGDGRFRYLGGWLIRDKQLQRRARQLAARALTALPQSCGYVGVDLVLGSAKDGSQDALIEVNPRLTTSYVGLRRVVSENLAGWWLHMGRGERPVGECKYRDIDLHFTPADGTHIGWNGVPDP